MRSRWSVGATRLESLFATDDGTVGVNYPRSDRIQVIRNASVTTRGKQLLARRLHVAGLVDRAAHDDRFAAVPVPLKVKACVCLRQDGHLKVRRGPSLAAIGA